MAHSSTLGITETVILAMCCSSILLVQAGMYIAQRHAHMSSCSLHCIKSKETRGVKMFPTKTSRDVGMVDGVSDATGRSMKKQTGRKSPGTRRCSMTV